MKKGTERRVMPPQAKEQPEAGGGKEQIFP